MWHLGITIKAQRQQWKITIRASAWKLEGPSGYTITIFGGGVGPTKNHACIHQLHSAILGSWKLGVYIYIHQYKRKSPEDECWSQTLFSTFFKKFHCKKLVWNTQLVLELPLLYFIEPLQSLVHAPGPPTTSTWRSPKGLAWHLRRSGRWEPNFDLVSPACFFLECVIGSIHIYIYTHMSMGAKQLMKLCWHHRVQYSTACLRGSLQPSATTNCHRKGYRSDM